jgi:hypothetical protein
MFMKNAQALVVIVIVTSLCSCVSTTRRAPEYGQQYYLAQDVNKYSSWSFTGWYSAWFTGPEKVDTIAEATIPVRDGSLLKKGCPVKVMQIFHVSGVDASSTSAKLQITDNESKSTFVVYVRWPGAKSLLTTDLPTSP